ncbi:MAG: Uma2 family endonuclease [Actinomycetes bacterium]
MTRADLDRMPDDGHRYEVIDGVLIVSPSPSRRHQRAVGRLLRLLEDACPVHLEVLVAPFDVVLADDTVLIPDIIVARRIDLTDRELPVAPALAVEILSPSTRRFDLMVKRSRLETAGAEGYWVVDPDEPSLTAWNLQDGSFVEVAHVVGDEPFAADNPFPLVVVPARLVSEH